MFRHACKTFDVGGPARSTHQETVVFCSIQKTSGFLLQLPRPGHSLPSHHSFPLYGLHASGPPRLFSEGRHPVLGQSSLLKLSDPLTQGSSRRSPSCSAGGRLPLWTRTPVQAAHLYLPISASLKPHGNQRSRIECRREEGCDTPNDSERRHIPNCLRAPRGLSRRRDPGGRQRVKRRNSRS